jgi:hypothetical protein
MSPGKKAIIRVTEEENCPKPSPHYGHHVQGATDKTSHRAIVINANHRKLDIHQDMFMLCDRAFVRSSQILNCQIQSSKFVRRSHPSNMKRSG